MQPLQQAFFYDSLYFHHIPPRLATYYQIKTKITSIPPSLVALESLDFVIALETDSPVRSRLSPSLVSLTSSLVSQGWRLLADDYLDLQHLILLQHHDYLHSATNMTQCLLDPILKTPLCKQYPVTHPFVPSTRFFIPLFKTFLTNEPVDLSLLNNGLSLLSSQSILQFVQSSNCRPFQSLCTQGIQWFPLDKNLQQTFAHFNHSIVRSLLSPFSEPSDSIGAVSRVCANYNQCVFIIDSQNRLYFRANSTDTNRMGSFWQRMEDQAISISLSTNTLYYIDINKQLLLRDMVYGYSTCSQGNTPKKVQIQGLANDVIIENVYSSRVDCLYLQDSKNNLYSLVSSNRPLVYTTYLLAQGVKYIIAEDHQVQVHLMNGQSFVQVDVYDSTSRQCLPGTQSALPPLPTHLIKSVINSKGCLWSLSDNGDLLQGHSAVPVRDTTQQTSFTDLSVSSRDLFLVDINGQIKVRLDIC